MTDRVTNAEAPSTTKKLPPAIHIAIFVFGKMYCELFTQVVARNLLAMVREIPGDLRSQSVVRISTTTEDKPFLESAPSMVSLRQVIRVEILTRELKSSSKYLQRYAPMVIALAELVKDAARVGAALFFVGPDQIYNRGAFAAHLERFRQGYRVIVGPGVRILKDAARPILLTAMERSSDGTFALYPEEQIRLLFDYWHPINDQFLLESEAGIVWKAYIYDRPAEEELLIRFFQGPTLAAWPRGPLENFEGYVDHDLMLKCCNHPSEIYVVPDAHECLALDLTEDMRRDSQKLAIFPRVDLLVELFNEVGVNHFQLHQGLVTCRVGIGHRGDALTAAWERRFSLRIDPLIMMAQALRRVRKVSPWFAVPLQFFLLAGTHTWSVLLRPLVRRHAPG